MKTNEFEVEIRDKDGESINNYNRDKEIISITYEGMFKRGDIIKILKKQK